MSIRTVDDLMNLLADCADDAGHGRHGADAVRGRPVVERVVERIVERAARG
jgi:hypothetical protein